MHNLQLRVKMSTKYFSIYFLVDLFFSFWYYSTNSLYLYRVCLFIMVVMYNPTIIFFVYFQHQIELKIKWPKSIEKNRKLLCCCAIIILFRHILNLFDKSKQCWLPINFSYTYKYIDFIWFCERFDWNLFLTQSFFYTCIMYMYVYRL